MTCINILGCTAPVNIMNALVIMVMAMVMVGDGDGDGNGW